jgi:hypothetical protein
MGYNINFVIDVDVLTRSIGINGPARSDRPYVTIQSNSKLDRSYSVITPPRFGNQTPPPPGGRGSRTRGRGTGGQNGPQVNADALRHPRPAATTASHTWCSRAGRESHDGKTNDDEGSSSNVQSLFSFFA